VVWIVPVIAVVVGGVWLGWSFRDWRSGRVLGATDEDRDLVARLRSES